MSLAQKRFWASVKGQVGPTKAAISLLAFNFIHAISNPRALPGPNDPRGLEYALLKLYWTGPVFRAKVGGERGEHGWHDRRG